MDMTRRAESWRRYPVESVPMYTWRQFQLRGLTWRRAAPRGPFRNAYSAFGWSGSVLVPCREGDGTYSCFTYTSWYFSLYERPGILAQNPFRTAKSIAELGKENILGLISRTLFITGRVVYPPWDVMISSLQVPTGDPDADHHTRSMIKSTGNLAIQKFRSLANVSSTVSMTSWVVPFGRRPHWV